LLLERGDDAPLSALRVPNALSRKTVRAFGWKTQSSIALR
jgi:hypothetical protein